MVLVSDLGLLTCQDSFDSVASVKDWQVSRLFFSLEGAVGLKVGLSALSVSVAGFLPCLEKHGKTVTLLAGPEDVHLVQNPVDTDGMHITARWAKVHTCSFWNSLVTP